MVDQHAMRHVRMPYASLKRCGKLVSDNSASDCKYHLSRSMLLSGTFLSLSTRLSACSSFSPHALFCLPPVSLWRLRDIPAFLIVFACLVSSRCATRGHCQSVPIRWSWGGADSRFPWYLGSAAPLVAHGSPAASPPHAVGSVLRS